MQSSDKQKGFSLVELSIVLVILGLLTGGILTGQSLIRAAELRSVTTEFQTYQTAVNTFKDKYFALPGDMRKATDFWGSAGGSGTLGDGCQASTGTGTQTCNGNGNGDVLLNYGQNNYAEALTFWQHLANAGLIEGAYTGIAGTGSNIQHIIEENAPRSKLSNSGWMVGSYGAASAHASRFDGNYGNIMRLGTKNAGGDLSNPIATPSEMWNIDEKIDDGKPGLGKVVVTYSGDCTPATASNELDAGYALTNNSAICAPIFRNVF